MTESRENWSYLNDPCFMDKVRFETFEFGCKSCKTLNYKYHVRRWRPKTGFLASLGRRFCTEECFQEAINE